MIVSILHTLLIADYERGLLYWRHRGVQWFSTSKHPKRAAASWNSRFAGKPALNVLDANGYLTGKVDKVALKAHVVLWAMANGEWPEGEIDHENGIVSDNRDTNLRDVSHKDNLRNAKLSKSSKSGVNGVTWNKKRGLWVAAITVDGTNKYLGGFPTIGEATAARKEADAFYGFHSNHGRLQ